MNPQRKHAASLFHHALTCISPISSWIQNHVPAGTNVFQYVADTIQKYFKYLISFFKYVKNSDRKTHCQPKSCASRCQHAETVPRLALCQTGLACEVHVQTIDVYLRHNIDILNTLSYRTLSNPICSRTHCMTKSKYKQVQAQNMPWLVLCKIGPACDCCINKT